MNTMKISTEAISSRVTQSKSERQCNHMVDNRELSAIQTKMLGVVQRMDDEEDLLQGKFEQSIQRMDDDEDLLQGKFEQSIQRMDDDEDLLQGKFEKPSQRADNQTGMPDDVKQRMETTFDADFSGVRVHPESSKAPDVGALAYTQGSDIHFAPGQFKPDTSVGSQLLGHELTHVVQQAAGRVQPTTEIGGMAVNDNIGLENEADIMGAKAAR